MTKFSKNRKIDIRSFNKKMNELRENFGMDYGRFHTYDDISDGVAWVDFYFIVKYKGREYAVFGTLSTAYHEIFEEKYRELYKSDPTCEERRTMLKGGIREYVRWLNSRTEGQSPHG